MRSNSWRSLCRIYNNYYWKISRKISDFLKETPREISERFFRSLWSASSKENFEGILREISRRIFHKNSRRLLLEKSQRKRKFWYYSWWSSFRLENNHEETRGLVSNTLFREITSEFPEEDQSAGISRKIFKEIHQQESILKRYLGKSLVEFLLK